LEEARAWCTLSLMDRIYLVDDDEGLRETLSMALEAEDYTVTAYHDGQEAWSQWELEAPEGQLVILDVLMPRLSGLELIQRMRSRGYQIPVLFLSSRDQEMDRILGLDFGGDDYLVKPFSVRELKSRVKALIRRSRRTQSSSDQLQQGPLSMNKELFMTLWHQEPVDLSPMEFRLLWTLAENPGRVFSRGQLHKHVYQGEVYVCDRTMDSHIKRIRKKFSPLPEYREHIETVYGIGYRWKKSSV
jgi:two-component system response regulator ChvI